MTDPIVYKVMPITEPPKEDGYYLFCYGDMSGCTCSYVVEHDEGSDGSELFKMSEHFTYWLKPVPLSELTAEKVKRIAELEKFVLAVASDAWDYGIERFCFDNGSEFVEGTPETKSTYIANLRKELNIDK